MCFYGFRNSVHASHIPIDAYTYKLTSATRKIRNSLVPAKRTVERKKVSAEHAPAPVIAHHHGFLSAFQLKVDTAPCGRRAQYNRWYATHGNVYYIYYSKGNRIYLLYSKEFSSFIGAQEVNFIWCMGCTIMCNLWPDLNAELFARPCFDSCVNINKFELYKIIRAIYVPATLLRLLR